DPALTRLSIDDVDRTARLTCPATEKICTAALLAEERLADGPHTLAVTVYDRAGNASRPRDTPYVFSVDTHAPTVGFDGPTAMAYLGSRTVPVTIHYGDPEPGSGIHRESVQILVDGVDQTASFTIDDHQATATLTLADGPHNVHVSVSDWATN